nr:MAG TPA: hypothetical protein [Caudoviricetes sp.]
MIARSTFCVAVPPASAFIPTEEKAVDMANT